MRKILFLIMVFCSTIGYAEDSDSIIAQIQSDIKHKNVTSIVIGDKTQAHDVEMAFRKNAPANINTAQLPRFAIIGNDNLFYLGIGAKLDARIMFDWGADMPEAYEFIPGNMSSPLPGNGGSTRFTAQNSEIYLNFVALPDNENSIGLYFCGQFKGENYGFKVDNFYATWRGLTVGYTASAFSDGAAIPYTIDIQGANGTAFWEGIMISWTHRFSNHISGAIGLDTPELSVKNYLKSEAIKQRIPSIPLYVQYAWGKDEKSHFRLSGVFRPVQYRNLIMNSNHTMTGWGIQTSGLVELFPSMTLYYDATYGNGIANYLQDGYERKIDAFACNDGSMKLTGTFASTIGLGYDFNEYLSANAMYSHLSAYANKTSLPDADAYHYGDYVAANIICKLNRIVEVGLEYNYGLKKSFDGDKLHVNRLQAQIAFSF